MRIKEREYLELLHTLRTFKDRNRRRGISSIEYYDFTDSLYLHFNKYPHYYSLGFYCRGYYKDLVDRIVRNHDKILETIEKLSLIHI